MDESMHSVGLFFFSSAIHPTISTYALWANFSMSEMCSIFVFLLHFKHSGQAVQIVKFVCIISGVLFDSRFIACKHKIGQETGGRNKTQQSVGWTFSFGSQLLFFLSLFAHDEVPG